MTDALALARATLAAPELKLGVLETTPPIERAQADYYFPVANDHARW